MVKNKNFLIQLRLISIIEGFSTLILFFIAMPLKYHWGIQQAVSWPGRVHGFLFVLLGIYTIIAIRKVPLPIKMGTMLIVASIFPFGPFIMERKLKILCQNN